MKKIKGLVLFSFLGVSVSSCFNEPEYGVAPSINFDKIEFKVTPNASDADSLILYIHFKDGDGDLGLDQNSLGDKSTPYHSLNFYLEGPNNAIGTFGTQELEVTSNTLPPSLPSLVGDPTGFGKLITHRTRLKPGFGFLPPFDPSELNCKNYTNDVELIIPPAFKNLVDESYHFSDTLYEFNDTQKQNPYYVVKDTLYFNKNLNNYNIIVRFYEKTATGVKEFKWEEEFCSTFNGRFPRLSDESGPLDGTIRYSMGSVGFLPIFSIKTLQLDVIIKDRALHKDSIRTPEFTLK